jgi:2-oxoisovalerate dehydrogenase E2 component (dihydrolipoyl transacylase)
MAAYTVKLPDVGEGIAQAEIVSWHVAVGDRIREDDVIAEIMTDKATVELPSPVTGVIEWLGGEVGDILSVGADLIRIETNGAALATLATPASAPGASDSDVRPRMIATGADPIKANTPVGRDMLDVNAPVAPNVTEANAPLLTNPPLVTNPSMVGGPSWMAGVENAEGIPVTERAMPPERHVRAQAAPAVRERARRLALDLVRLRGSGPGGRIVHEDLDEAIMKRRDFNRGTKPSDDRSDSMHAPTLVTPHLDAHLDPQVQDAAPEIERIKIIGLRRNIAERMQLSKRRIPHFTYVEEIDVTELERLRQQLNSSPADRATGPLNNRGVSPVSKPVNEFAGDSGSNPPNDQVGGRIKLTVLPFIMRAVVKAIASHPQMNARFDDDAGVLERHSEVRLGIAVQTAKGLMVPVVKGMRTLDLWESAAEVARLSELARTSKIKIEDLVGSTITLTSLGTLGGIMSTPVINYPEVAVIGVNKIVERPVYVDHELVPRKTMNLSSSFDHRVIDGADAAAFIQAVKGLLETPALLFI